MNSKQIEEEVIRYLGDDNYRYAILIEGEWGCGKTYFVQNELQKAIYEYETMHDKRNLRYISLYGCKSVEEVEENLYWSIVDKQFYETYDKLINIENYYGQKKEKIKQGSKIFANVSRKVISKLMQRFEIPYKAYEWVSDFFVLSQNIFIFDDLERCNCSPNDILGYINGLVEHEGVKVILVANEKEVGTLTELNNKELQYVVAANAEIEVTKEKLPFVHERTSEKSKLDIDELERRRKLLFDNTEFNIQYLRIREKLIGQTLRYETDFVSIIHKLITDCNAEKELKEILKNNVKYFIDTMKEYNHGNLRTVQFFLSKIEYLYEQLKDVSIEEKYYQNVLGFVVQNCFMLCVEYRGNVQETKNEYVDIIFKNKRRLHSIYDYVKYSIYNEEKYSSDIRNYITAEISSRLPVDDPYMQLYNQYYIKSQEWVERKIRQVSGKLENNDYNIAIYPQMYIIFMRLVEYGFPESILQQAEQYMLRNVQQWDIEDSLDDFVASDNPKEIMKCKELIHKINREISITQNKSRQEKMQEILNEESLWGEKLNKYWLYNKDSLPYEVQLLSCIGADVWVEKIKNSSAEDIHYFRHFLHGLYPKDSTKSNVYDDMQVIEIIVDNLENYDEADIIKRAQLNWLKEQLFEIKERYERRSSQQNI